MDYLCWIETLYSNALTTLDVDYSSSIDLQSFVFLRDLLLRRCLLTTVECAQCMRRKKSLASS